MPLVLSFPQPLYPLASMQLHSYAPSPPHSHVPASLSRWLYAPQLLCLPWPLQPLNFCLHAFWAPCHLASLSLCLSASMPLSLSVPPHLLVTVSDTCCISVPETLCPSTSLSLYLYVPLFLFLLILELIWRPKAELAGCSHDQVIVLLFERLEFPLEGSCGWTMIG